MLLFLIMPLIAVLPLSLVTQASANTQLTPLTQISDATARLPEQTVAVQAQSKFRIRNFTEFMTPAFQGRTRSIPNRDGSEYIPATLFNILAIDYEIAPDYRILYHQRALLMLTPNSSFQGLNLFGRDPRFALRRTQVFDVPHVNTTYDLYVQPGIANNQLSDGNSFEVGFRTNTSYSPPGTRWNFGLLQEFTTRYLNPSGQGRQRAYGWFMPWVSYDLSQKISLQHFTTLPFTNLRSQPWTSFQWDDPPPFIQNGIGLNLTKTVSASLFINNYLGVGPTLSNTWASVWLSLDLL